MKELAYNTIYVYIEKQGESPISVEFIYRGWEIISAGLFYYIGIVAVSRYRVKGGDENYAELYEDICGEILFGEL